MVFRLSTTFTRITAALIRGRRTLTLFVSNAALIQGRRSYGGGTHSSKYGILGVIRVFLIATSKQMFNANKESKFQSFNNRNLN